MTETKNYDIGVIGGGLAGLSLSIQLSRLGHSVVLFEKETYPFHKVCGEYISMESWDFLASLGVPLDKLELPRIDKLLVSAPNGTMLNSELDLGGFGISRHMLDNNLKQIAFENGVQIYEDCKVTDVHFGGNEFTIDSIKGRFFTKVCCGSFGKRSNLDVKFKRSFLSKTNKALNNYVAIKYHIRTNHPADTIALHNFENGYCGISRIEDGKYCLCYLTTAENLRRSNHSIPEMEKNILSQNPWLKTIFTTSEWLFEQPVTISQISFSEKSQVFDHMLMLGDAAGMITPLCGNGMSMALQSSKLASEKINQFLQDQISRNALEESYAREWKQLFSVRLKFGRTIQSLFGKKKVTNMFVGLMKRLPFLTGWLIKQTHGKPF